MKLAYLCVNCESIRRTGSSHWFEKRHRYYDLVLINTQVEKIYCEKCITDNPELLNPAYK